MGAIRNVTVRYELRFFFSSQQTENQNLPSTMNFFLRFDLDLYIFFGTTANTADVGCDIN